MSKTKKIFVTLFCIILATIMLANNSMSYAASARKNLGTRYTLGLGDLVDRNDLYCVARGKHLYFEDE